ncbi:MAG TPA: GPP34 family phosphoprotein [Pseudonocardia sp.]|nr:GPP34 family phosphoprotein [Pseudonocardia sp.]
MTTFAQDLVLLLHDPVSGRPLVDRTSLDRAAGGALLLDLTATGRVRADGEGKRARITVTDPSPTGDPLLDDALRRLGRSRPGGSRRAPGAVERLARRTRPAVLRQLVARGVLREEPSRVLGIFPRTSWPALDPAPRAELVARIAAVLLDGVDPDERLAVLISLVHAVRAEHKVVDGPRRALRARAAQVAAGDWAGAAVRSAVQSVQISVATAVAASGAAGGAAGAAGSS